MESVRDFRNRLLVFALAMTTGFAACSLTMCQKAKQPAIQITSIKTK